MTIDNFNLEPIHHRKVMKEKSAYVFQFYNNDKVQRSN